MNLNKSLRQLIAHVHTEAEIQQAALEKYNEQNDSMICVISNTENPEHRKVSLFNGQKLVYCCDMPAGHAEQHGRGLNGLINRFNASSPKFYVDLR